MKSNSIQEPFFINYNQSKIHVWLTGNKNGPLIALSHGASMDHRMFYPQIECLVKAGYRVLTWDMRAHGKSKLIGKLPITVKDLANDMLYILDDFGITNPICFMGHSLGGYVVQDIVHRYPERVHCIVIIGSTCITMPIAWWEWMALKTSPLWIRLWPYNHFRKLLAKTTALQPEVQSYAFEVTGQLKKHEFVEVWKAVAGAIQPVPNYYIEHPLLLTHGDKDRTGNIAKKAPYWAERDPNCVYQVIPEASHNANQDNPDQFNRILIDFLNEHYPCT